MGKLSTSRRYNRLPLLRSSPGGFAGSWPYRTYPYTFLQIPKRKTRHLLFNCQKNRPDNLIVATPILFNNAKIYIFSYSAKFHKNISPLTPLYFSFLTANLITRYFFVLYKRGKIKKKALSLQAITTHKISKYYKNFNKSFIN